MAQINILTVGDVVGSSGVSYLAEGRRLSRAISDFGAHFTVVNAENSADGNGMLPQSAKAILDAGADVLTGGNHTYRRREVYTTLDDCENILRPANIPAAAPGHGYTVVNAGGIRILVMNLLGVVFMEPLASPFETADAVLSREAGNFDIALVDFHAEATSEKLALAHYLCPRVSAVWGTHTHVATADAQIIGNHTGYITDLGMTGSRAGIIGVKTEGVLHKFIEKTPVRFETAHGDECASGALFTIDTDTGACVGAQGIEF